MPVDASTTAKKASAGEGVSKLLESGYRNECHVLDENANQRMSFTSPIASPRIYTRAWSATVIGFVKKKNPRVM